VKKYFKNISQDYCTPKKKEKGFNFGWVKSSQRTCIINSSLKKQLVLKRFKKNMEDKKNVFIVYAHQEPKSFNGALKDKAVQVLKDQGHTVTVSDLYAMRFDPTASKHTFKG
jgi:hypothetical protein